MAFLIIIFENVTNYGSKEMMEKERQKEDQNEYAKNIKGEIKFILDVESGRKGYWCLGCDEEMQAVHFKVEHYRSYFRHDAKDVKIERKCTFSNQDFRHRLAMDILARTKRIKVPNLYKFSPDGSSKILLEESKFVESHSVKAELTFYEDNNGLVQWGKNPDVDEKYLLIRPDITFFDMHEKPILLIEIVVTHKINDEKRIKLKRLGIDTIQITVPKDSPENIAKSLEITQHTKWVYNHVEQTTNYLHLSKADREGISSADAVEMGLFRETFACRESQIKNLIRAITRCLESQYYRGTEQEFRSELSRVAGNTSRDLARLEALRAEHRGRVERRYSEQIAAIEEDERQFDVELGATEAEIRRKDSELEQRYLAEKRSIEELSEEFGNVEGKQRALDAESKAIGDKIRTTDERIEAVIRDRRNIPIKYERLHNKEQSRFEDAAAGIRKAEESIPNDIIEGKRALESRFKADRESTIEIVASRNSRGDSELSEGIKRIFAARGIILNFNEREIAYKRNRTAYDCFMDGTYKSWFGS
ncbi:MAG: hypothetical protein DI588_09155 [Flavobacterium johnsoniae]|nr:MAG: hypothetical protein DI588_09155 [Flavobacterium johnsoniae]